MLSSLFSGSATTEMIILQIFTFLVILLVCFPIHECAHGFMARLLGDRTAEESGRLTLNPFQHIDFMGAISMLLFGIGWAKPVPVNPSRCTKLKPKAAMAVIAAAGPLSNLLLAFVFTIVYTIVYFVNIDLLQIAEMSSVHYVLSAIYLVITYNVYLALFNLIPVPPFDGSRIFLAFLPTNLYFKVMKYERVIMVVIMLLLFSGVVSLPLAALTDRIIDGMFFLTSFIGKFFGY